MEGKLIKTGDQFLLRNKEDEVIAITSGTMEGRMLSLKNCQAIENGYDLDEVAREACDITDPLRLDSQKYKQDPYFKIGFIKGFQKALSILGDKKFSEEDMKKAMNKIVTATYSNKGDDVFDLFIEIHREKYMDEYIKSLQQTEWDVEIEMEQYVKYVPKSLATVYPTGGVRPKLDSNGCLILRRK